MIIGFLSGGFIGLVAAYEHGHGELYLCPNCSYLLLNSASRNNWCPNCKTRINWKKVDELGGEEKCGR